jgi:hypothetical protein
MSRKTVFNLAENFFLLFSVSTRFFFIRSLRFILFFCCIPLLRSSSPHSVTYLSKTVSLLCYITVGAGKTAASDAFIR